MFNYQKEVQVKLTKGLLEMIILQMLKTDPMHGYQIITNIRRTFGVYLGPSTVYPMLTTLERKGYVDSKWDLTNERPRKVYSLTPDGDNILTFTEGSLTLICRNITRTSAPEAAMIMPVSATSGKAKRIIIAHASTP